MTRTAIFNILIGVIIGGLLAVGYAWSRPPNPSDASIASLRADYKTDIVVMIAQGYAVDSNLDLARSRLAALNVKDSAQHSIIPQSRAPCSIAHIPSSSVTSFAWRCYWNHSGRDLRFLDRSGKDERRSAFGVAE
ncbi:MAG: hypothetical protein HZC38_16655 [Chloroflexi bacterium]|nr:hypothetical protein [Chloroflexota bacterium]